MSDDTIGRPHLSTHPQGLNEHLVRIADALALSRATNHPPRLDTVPGVLVNWDFSAGVLTIAHCKSTELEVHIVYLRIADIQTTFAQMMDVAGQTRAAKDDYLRAMGDVMAGQRPPARLLK